MSAVKRVTFQETEEITAETDRKLSALLSHQFPTAELNRRILHVVAMHIRKCGQEELGERVEDILLQCEDFPGATPEPS